MPRNPLLIALAICALATTLAQAGTFIPAGTILQCTVDEPNFSAKTAMVGDPVLCHLGPLGEFGHSVFPRGATLGGHPEDYKNPGHFVGKGWIQVEFDRLIVPGMEPLPLSAKIISGPHKMKVDPQGDIHGTGHPKRDAIEWMIPVLWPIKIATLPARGPYPGFKGESRIALRLMADVELPYSRSSVPMPPWAAPSAYRVPNSLYDSLPHTASTTSQPAVTVMPATFTQRSEPATQLAATANESPMTIIALKDGSAMVARQYWVQNGQLQCVTDKGAQKALPLEKVDLYQTTQLNRERNVDFVLKSSDAVEQ